MKSMQNSISAGGSIFGAVNKNNSYKETNVNIDILAKARKEAFFVSLITGIISSFVASILFKIFVG